MNMTDKIRRELFSQQDEGYARFQRRLMPSVLPDWRNTEKYIRKSFREDF